MHSYKEKNNYKVNYAGTNCFLFSFDDKQKLREAMLDFPQEKFIELNIKNLSKKKINKYIEENNINTIITDNKRIFKKASSENSFLFVTKKYENIVINNSNETLNNETKLKYQIVTGTNLLETVKKTKLSSRKIVELNKNHVSVAVKVGGSWKFIDDLELEIMWSRKNKKTILTEHNFIPKIIDSSNPAAKGVKITDEIVYTDKYDDNYNKNKINWVLSDFFYSDYLNSKKQYSYFIYKIDKIKTKNENFENFKNLLQFSDEIKGIEIKDKAIKDNEVKLITSYGEINLLYENEELTVYSNLTSRSEEHKIIAFYKGMITNIKNNVNLVYAVNKLDYRKIIQSIIGLVILILLMFLTFNYIYSSENISDELNKIFSSQNFSKPWIYFIFASFFLSFFWSFLVAVFVEKYILKNKKMNYKRLIVYFYAGILRKLSSFLTGNYFISVFIWGWYLRRKINIRSASLVASISWLSIIRAIVYVSIGTIFMLSGTSSYYIIANKFNLNPNSNAILIFVLAWIGFAWEAFHSFWVFFLILSPTIFMLANHLTMKIRFRKKILTRNYLDETYINFQIMNHQKSTFSLKREKDRIMRVTLMVLGPIILEGIETILYFNMIDSLYAVHQQYYWNFVSLSGLRLVSNNIHNFPLLNILPGQGIGFTEFGLNNLYEIIFASKHIGESNPYINGLQSSDLSQMTSFITRFFNVYFYNAVVLISSIFVIGYELIIRKTERKIDI